MGLWVYHDSFSGKILLKTVEVVKNKDVFWQINLEERLQMDQLSEQGGVLDRLFPPMVVSSTEEQLALGDRSQWSNPSAHSTVGVGAAVSPGLPQVTTFQLIWDKSLQGKSCIMVNAIEAGIAPMTKHFYHSFHLVKMLSGFQSLCCQLECKGEEQ